MISAFLHYEQSEIHYLQYGTGSTTVVCLHGYGETAASFNPLASYLAADFLLLAIDLPYHGETRWNEQRALRVTDLSTIIEKILLSLGIIEKHFMLLGFSMGGRIALSLLQQMPDRVSRLVLLAPDGLNINFWYWLATQTFIGSKAFRVFTGDKIWLSTMLKISTKLDLIDKTRMKFIRSYIENEESRRKLYVRWICLRRFKPDNGKIRTIIRQRRIPVKMLYGRYDRITVAKKADKFQQGLHTLCELQVIECGHQLLHPKHAAVIIKLLTA